MKKGTLVKYNDAGNIIKGVWNGKKVQCTDKDKTTVYNTEWLTPVKFQFISKIIFKIFNKWETN